MPKQIIKLGDRYRLHVGYHGVFLRNPNKYFTFEESEPEILFCLLKDNKREFHPAEHPFYFEIHKYPDDANFIHSHLFPVYNRVPWIVDMENMPFQLLGRAYVNESLMRKLHRDYFKNPLHRETFLSKIRLYSSRYCKAILYWSINEILDTINCFKRYGIYNAPEVKIFMDKIILAYPVVKPLARKAVLHNPRTIIFLARDFERKGGPIALATFQRLHKYDPNLILIYVGPIPEMHKKLYSELLEHMIYFPGVSHDQALFLLKRSDILIFPTLNEAFGVTLIEAMAAGCVPLTYFGPGVAAASEIIENHKNGILLKKPERIVIVQEAKKFLKSIINLLSNDKLLKIMKERALIETNEGKFSFSKRIELLKSLFIRPIRKLKEMELDLTRYKIYSYSAGAFSRMMTDYHRIRKIPNRIFIEKYNNNYKILS